MADFNIRELSEAAPARLGGGVEAIAPLVQRRAPRKRLGRILIDDGAMSERTLEGALVRQRETRARLGDILISRFNMDRRTVAAAAARQIGVDFADLDAEAPETASFQDDDLEAYVTRGVMPLRRDRRGAVMAAVDPRAAVAGADAFGDRVRFVQAEPQALRRRLIEAFPHAVSRRAAIRRREDRSLRPGPALWQRGGAIAIVLAVAGLAASAPQLVIALALWFACVVMTVNGALWLAATLSALRKSVDEAAAPASPDADRLADFRPSPKVTLLIPLYKEAATAPILLEALTAFDYPSELLDIKIILEADDDETGPALRACAPPVHIEILTAPDGAPRTKPRALNFALDFAEGEIIGVYDAEDRPPPDQIRRIVRQFAAAPPQIACIQARLGYYNARENWLTRCFEIEYASWFDVMLPSLRRLGAPLPLGGTSLFIRRGALEAVSGWDSHNVTEDADLGVMLARAGLKTALSPSLTSEEAASRPGQWIKQRSRWLKGYMATWMTHMRDPLAFASDLGLWAFIGANAILLSAALGYLLLPIMWLAVLFEGALGGSAAAPLTVLRFAATATLLVIALAGMIGLSKRGRQSFWPCILTAPIYWVLGAAAAYLAVWELVFAPEKWRKTNHGVGRIASQMRAEALERRIAAEDQDRAGGASK